MSPRANQVIAQPNPPERTASGQNARLPPGRVLHSRTPEETVILDTLFPKVLALVPSVEHKLHHVLVVSLK